MELSTQTVLESPRRGMEWLDENNALGPFTDWMVDSAADGKSYAKSGTYGAIAGFLSTLLSGAEPRDIVMATAAGATIGVGAEAATGGRISATGAASLSAAFNTFSFGNGLRGLFLDNDTETSFMKAGGIGFIGGALSSMFKDGNQDWGDLAKGGVAGMVATLLTEGVSGGRTSTLTNIGAAMSAPHLVDKIWPTSGDSASELGARAQRELGKDSYWPATQDSDGPQTNMRRPPTSPHGPN